jgi:hypothetical protein
VDTLKAKSKTTLEDCKKTRRNLGWLDSCPTYNKSINDSKSNDPKRIELRIETTYLRPRPDRRLGITS